MESTDAVGASRRAQDLRADLTARLDVETMLAEASAARHAAVVDADAIIAQAQQVSEQLLRDSRSEAEGLVADARDDSERTLREARAAADAVRARAEADVEDHRRRVRAEVTEQVTRDVLDQARQELTSMREQSVGMIGDLEASVHILGVSLETARTNVGDMLARLEGLRAHTSESLGATAAGAAPQARDAAAAGHRADPAGGEDAETRDDDPPLTATEAYLRSSHIDFGDPPLPPMDQADADADAAARYGRDAGHGSRPHLVPDRSGPGDELGDARDIPGAFAGANGSGDQHGRDQDQGNQDGGDQDDGDQDGDDRSVASGDAAGRPLGWLFRSPS